MNIITNVIKKLQSSTASSAPACRTRMVSDRFFECKVRKPNPMYCDHSLSSGDGFICNHRDRALFAGK